MQTCGPYDLTAAWNQSEDMLRLAGFMKLCGIEHLNKFKL